MKTYKAKPVLIQAILWVGNNINEVREQIPGAKSVNKRLRLFTANGSVWADEGDYIVKGTSGEWYPCKPNIFVEKYTEIHPTVFSILNDYCVRNNIETLQFENCSCSEPCQSPYDSCIPNAKIGLIVGDYLKQHDFSGLINEECNCTISNLFHCGENNVHCGVAYRVQCKLNCGETCLSKEKEFTCKKGK